MTKGNYKIYLLAGPAHENTAFSSQKGRKISHRHEGRLKIELLRRGHGRQTRCIECEVINNMCEVVEKRVEEIDRQNGSCKSKRIYCV